MILFGNHVLEIYLVYTCLPGISLQTYIPGRYQVYSMSSGRLFEEQTLSIQKYWIHALQSSKCHNSGMKRISYLILLQSLSYFNLPNLTILCSVRDCWIKFLFTVKVDWIALANLLLSSNFVISKFCHQHDVTLGILPVTTAKQQRQDVDQWFSKCKIL